MGRVLSGLAAFLILAGASFFVLFRLCERCGQDNAYLGEVLLEFVGLVVGLGCGLLWLLASRRGGLGGLAAGAIPGGAVGAVIVALGASRTLLPPALSAVELVLLAAGAAVTVATARRGSSRRV